MSSFFVINNIHFALETFGALAFLMVSWLAFDSLFIRRDILTGSRAIGFLLLAVWQIFHAFQFADERLQYLGYLFYITGLFIVLYNLLLEAPVERPEFKLILPPIVVYSIVFDGIAAVLLFVIAVVAYRQYLKEQKIAIRLLSFAFFSLAIGYAISLLYDRDTFNLLWGIQHLFEFAGFVLISAWVWQYLQSRIREELAMIFVSVALLISTAVTLVFSVVSAVRLERLNADNLAVNVGLFELSISNLKEGLASKLLLIASDRNVAELLNTPDSRAAMDIIDNLSSDMGLSSFVIADRAGNVISRAFSAGSRQGISDNPLFQSAMAGDSTSVITQDGDNGLIIRATAPVRKDSGVIGVVVADLPLDNAFIDNINRITGLEMAVFRGDTVVAGTSFGSLPAARIGVKETNSRVIEEVLNGGRHLTVGTSINSRRYVASYKPIFDHQDRVVGMISVAKSSNDILELSNQTNRLTLLTVIAVILAFVTPFYLITRRLSYEV